MRWETTCNGYKHLFAVHEPLPARLTDEGAANAMRLTASHGEHGLEIFVYGGSSGRYPARQNRIAGEGVRYSIPALSDLGMLESGPTNLASGLHLLRSLHIKHRLIPARWDGDASHAGNSQAPHGLKQNAMSQAHRILVSADHIIVFVVALRPIFLNKLLPANMALGQKVKV